MDVLSPRDSLFDDLLEATHALPDLVEIEGHRRRPRREPIYSVETLRDAGSAREAVLEDARPIVAFVSANLELFRSAQPAT